MTPEEYAAQQAVISAAVATFVAKLAQLFLIPQLAPLEWIRLLEVLFPEVQARRQEAAELARRFFDEERRRQRPDLPRHDTDLVPYSFDQFVRGMDPVRKVISQAEATDKALGALARQTVREVENGGRRQIIQAVESDRGVRRGWARVATGRETCAWCLMLISRGPVYMSADTAGLDLADQTAESMIAAGEDVSDHMSEWHPGCDCKVVPVYSADWPGREAAERALELWKAASTEAAELIRSGKARSQNFNREAINALRRRLERGGISISDYAGIAA